MRCRKPLPLLAALLALLATTPTSAGANPPGGGSSILVVSKTGGALSCSGGGHVAIQAYGSGLLRWYVPANGSLRFSDDHGGIIYATTWWSNYTSVQSWMVTSTDYLQDAGTYAFCDVPGLAGR